MKLSTALAPLALVALSACASSQSTGNASLSGYGLAGGNQSQLLSRAHNDINTCATDPPQTEWIFEGACEKITLSPSGGSFNLDTYSGIKVTGTIGNNALPQSVTWYVADAIGHGTGDIESWGGGGFPNFKGPSETGVIYVEFMNSSPYKFNMVDKLGQPAWTFTVTDSSGFPGNTCTTDLLADTSSGWVWGHPVSDGNGTPYGDKVKLIQAGITPEFYFYPDTPQYFEIFCFNSSR